MRRIRAIINAVLVATLLKPMLRRSIARWRREARESAEATIVIPAHELLETVLAARLGSEALSPQATPEELGDVAGRSNLWTVLILGTVAALTAASVIAIAALRRRRRAALTHEPQPAKELVAVPVEVPSGEAETLGTQAAPSSSPR